MTGFLPLHGEERPERSDAAANREKALAAAEKLFACEDPSTVSMDAVAAAAGVGKGTLFRRFGDRAGLARAVLSRHEIAFQDEILRGAPPLGPGAGPLERLIAFGAAYLEFLESHGALLREAEGAHDAFLHSDVYAFYRTHVVILLREAGLGEPRADFLADVVMFPLAATAHSYFRGMRALSCEQLADAHADLCTRLLTSSR
jgi:AcrR family transcriptional regulator